MRPSKDEYYMDIAEAVSRRSTCLRRQFGAIIVKDDVIVSTGYNGPARGVVNCMEVGCLKDEVNAPHNSGYDYCIGVHAEENTVINAARHGANVMNGLMYIYGRFSDGKITESKPCDRCKRAIINSGITEVIIMKPDKSMAKIKVSEWAKEDSENYLKNLEEARKNKL